jgi:hypothetical protein
VIYNIPAGQAAVYRESPIVLRVHNLVELQQCLSAIDLQNLAYVQWFIPDSDNNKAVLQHIEVPIDLVLSNPVVDFPCLYDYAALANDRPLRVSIPVVPGFSKAVKLAVSLNCAVKLEVAQPDSDLIAEMVEVVQFYLRQSTVAQDIEYFHSLLSSFYRQEPVTIWEIQEEDPTYSRYIPEQGTEIIAPRFSGASPEFFIHHFKDELLANKAECCDCDFFTECQGYFKWPDRNYRCDGIKSIFQILRDAALELKNDLLAHDAGLGLK